MSVILDSSDVLNSPQIFVEKIITCEFNEETKETTYCIKWEESWLTENVVSIMFPDLLTTFKTTDEYLEIIQNTTDTPENETNDTTKSYMFYEALNVMTLLGPVDVDYTRENRSGKALNLFTINEEHNNLVRWVEKKESKVGNTKSSRGRKNKKVKLISAEDYIQKEADGRSKRLRKPSAKKMANEEIEKKRQRTLSEDEGGENTDGQDERITKRQSDGNLPSAKKKKGRPPISTGGRNDPVECDICGKVVRRRRFQSHRALHSTEGKHQCTVCGKVCGTRSDLVNHALIHGSAKYTCEYCGQKFKQPAPYRIHMKTHTIEQNWMCDVCFQTFKFQGDLKKHCYDDHANIALNPQQCCVCKEKLKSPNSVYRHSVGHTGVRSFECGVCNKKFKHKSHLEKHLLMHERQEREKLTPAPEGPFQCEICGKEFDQLQSIKIHLGRHKANQENSLEEYIQKKAVRTQASKERYRKNARVYKQRYKVMQTEKQRILKELGLDPSNPILKTIDFKNLVKAFPGSPDDDTGDVVGDSIEAQIMISAANVLAHAQQQEDSHILVDEENHGQVIYTTTSVETVEDQLIAEAATVEEVETNIVDTDTTSVDVVIDTQLEANKAVEYVVAEGSTVVVEHGTEVHEITMEDLDSGLTLLNFLRHGKAV